MLYKSNGIITFFFFFFLINPFLSVLHSSIRITGHRFSFIPLISLRIYGNKSYRHHQFLTVFLFSTIIRVVSVHYNIRPCPHRHPTIPLIFRPVRSESHVHHDVGVYTSRFILISLLPISVGCFVFNSIFFFRVSRQTNVIFTLRFLHYTLQRNR